MMMTVLRCWWQIHYVGDFCNRSPTHHICKQHKLSPISVINNDVAENLELKIQLNRYLSRYFLTREPVNNLRNKFVKSVSVLPYHIGF